MSKFFLELLGKIHAIRVTLSIILVTVPREAMQRPNRYQRHSHAVTILLVVSAMVCAFRPADAADWRRPLTWIPDRFKPPGVGGKPGWEKVLIWDEVLGGKRGVRVALMPVVENEYNVPIDRRMTTQMKTYMLHFCDEVITVLDIEDADLRERLDNVLNTCINQWKQQGRIDSEMIINRLPDIAFDAVVLFERSLYEQGWRGDRKIFRVGLLGAAFAVDTGDMIFLHEVVEESSWSGIQNTILRVERLTVRSFLNEFYSRLVEISKRIDAEHEKAIEAVRRAAEERRRERLALLEREEKDLRRLTEEASAVLLSATEPRDVIEGIRRARRSIVENLKRPSAEQMDEELEARGQTAAELRVLLAQERAYAAEQERQSRLPPPDRPVVAPRELPGTEEPSAGGLLIDFSGIVTPTPTPLSTPRDYVPPGLFELPPRRVRRKPLPPLRSTLPTPTPTATPQARRVRTLRESPLSAAAALPLSASAAIPFPATTTVTEPTGTISPATLPVVAPPSESNLKDIETIRRRNKG